MASLQKFKSSFKTDLARPNRFEVLLNLPNTLLGSTAIPSNYQDGMRYRCEVAQLPGKTFDTVEQKTYGPIEKFPNLVTYTDIDLTFIVDDTMQTKTMFDTWLNYINPSRTNNLTYKSDYAADIQIYQYTVTNELAYGVNLIDAYPISMNQLDLDWSSDGYHKLNVTFAYTYWNRVY
jgi:hypothetical protein